MTEKRWRSSDCSGDSTVQLSDMTLGWVTVSHINQRRSVSILVNSQSGWSRVPEGEVKSRWAGTLSSFCPQRQHNLAADGWTTLGGGAWAQDSDPSHPRGSWEADRREENKVGRVWHRVARKKPGTSCSTLSFAISLTGWKESFIHSFIIWSQVESSLPASPSNLDSYRQLSCTQAWIITYKFKSQACQCEIHRRVSWQPPATNICHMSTASS